MHLNTRFAAAAAVFVVAVAIAGCGSGSRTTLISARVPSQRRAQAHASGLSYARCMRAHGVSNFPDPTPDGAINLKGSGINLSAPAVKAAETACQSLLPQKRVPYQAPSAPAYRRLLHWAKCMRAHGISHLSDPKPDPTPNPGSAAALQFRTLMGDGGYWIGIPITTDAHSPAFVRLSTRCGESPGGRKH
jgi:hypothetical protein